METGLHDAHSQPILAGDVLADHDNEAHWFIFKLDNDFLAGLLPLENNQYQTELYLDQLVEEYACVIETDDAVLQNLQPLEPVDSSPNVCIACEG